MRLSHIFLLFVFIYVYNENLAPLSISQNINIFKMNVIIIKNFDIYYTNTYLIFLIISIIIQIFFILFLNCCNSVKFIPLSTNLNLIRKTTKQNTDIYLHFYPLLLIIVSTYSIEWFLIFSIISFEMQIIKLKFKLSPHYLLVLHRIISYASTICFFYKVIEKYNILIYFLPNLIEANILSPSVNLTQWLTFILLFLSNDIESNPGPYQNGFLKFMNYNINSIAKDNFQRINSIEAHNSLFNYDIISLCETSLNDSVEIPEPLLENYTFIPKLNKDNTRHGGVGLFYKNSLPLKVRNDLSFDESIVIELNFKRKKIFFTVLYRSPSIRCNSPEFDMFLTNFSNLYEIIKKENPFAVFFAGDFNAHSKLWWSKGDTTPEVEQLKV